RPRRESGVGSSWHPLHLAEFEKSFCAHGYGLLVHALRRTTWIVRPREQVCQQRRFRNRLLGSNRALAASNIHLTCSPSQWCSRSVNESLHWRNFIRT